MMPILARETPRQLTKLSDMQAIMEHTQAFENRVLERLNAGKTVRSFLIAAVELLNEAINILVLQVFRKDDYAVKYAVEPLLDGDGPLGNLSVRLKLIYGLGVISRAEYEDAELLMALREELTASACVRYQRCRFFRHGRQGVANLLDLIEKEMRVAMTLTGAKSIREISKESLVQAQSEIPAALAPLSHGDAA